MRKLIAAAMTAAGLVTATTSATAWVFEQDAGSGLPAVEYRAVGPEGSWVAGSYAWAESGDSVSSYCRAPNTPEYSVCYNAALDGHIVDWANNSGPLPKGVSDYDGITRGHAEASLSHLTAAVFDDSGAVTNEDKASMAWLPLPIEIVARVEAHRAAQQHAAEVADLRAQLAVAEARAEAAEQKSADNLQGRQAAEARIEELEQEAQRDWTTIVRKDEVIADLRRDLSDAEERRDTLEQESVKTIGELTERAKRAEAAESRLLAELEQTQKRVVASVADDMDQAKDQIAKLEEQVGKLRSEADDREGRLATVEKATAERDQAVVKLASDVGQLNESLVKRTTALQDAITANASHIADLKAADDEFVKQLAAITAKGTEAPASAAPAAAGTNGTGS